MIPRVLVLAMLASLQPLAVPVAPLVPGAQEPATTQAVRARPTRFDPARSDAAALELVDQLWESMGGKAAFDRARYFQFEFVAELSGTVVATRAHLYDRKSNRDRLEIKTNRGLFVGLADLQERKAVAKENGEEIPETDRAAVEARVLEYCESDVNWLLLPWRLKDPGAIVKKLDDVEISGRAYPRIELRFEEGAELLPGESYVFTLDPVGHRLAQWSFRTKGAPEDAEPLAFAQLAWEDVGDVQLSTEKQGLNNEYRILFKDTQVLEAAPDGAYDGL